MARKLAQGVRDRVSFAYLVVGMLLAFIAQLPGLRRQAQQSDPQLEEAIRAEAGDVRQIESVAVPQDMIDAKFEAYMSGALIAWIFIMPLIFYLLAGLSVLGVKLFKGKMTGMQARLALFWSFLAATPLLLFQGLVAGFIGEGPALYGVFALWLGVFLWFWISSMREAGWGVESGT